MAKEPILIDLPEALVGQKVRLRTYLPGDGAALFEAVEESREHIRPWLPWAHEHRTPEESEGLVRRFHARTLLREDLMYAVLDRETGRYEGGIGLHRIDWKARKFEVGYWLRKSAEGRGYMTEAVRMLTDLAFETLEANRVFIRCSTKNARSAAIPQRLGFVYEGTFANDGVSADGDLFDSLVFGLTPELWRKASTEA